MIKPSESNRPGLDGSRSAYRPFGAFRFMLAMMVLMQHGLLLVPQPSKAVFYTLELGAVAVTCFFVLSGFIVGEALSSFYAQRPLAFLGNRILRVVPPYLAALGLAMAVQSALFALGHLVPLDAAPQGVPWQPQILLAGVFEIVPGLPTWRLSGQSFSFVPFAWTLRIEFAFYGIAFATCWAMDRLGGHHASLRRCVAWGVALAAAAAFGLFLLRHGAGPKQLLCVPFFAFGLLCFALDRHRCRMNWVRLLCVAVWVPIAFTYWGQRGHPVLAYQLPWLCALLAVLLGLSRLKSVPERVRRIDRRLGDLSYPLYIGHGVILVLLASLFAARGWPIYAAGVLGSLMLAAALHETSEKPLRRWRDRLRGTQL